MRTIRTYFAGLGSSGALLGAAIAAFVALSALVAVDGLPGSSARSNDSVVLADSNAPEIAAATAADPAVAPAAVPAALPAAAVPPAPASAPAGPATASAPNPPSVPGAPGSPGPGPSPAPAPVPPAQAPGDVAGVVGQVDDTVTGATGIDLGLAKKTKPLTDALDHTIRELTGGKGLGLDKVKLPDVPKVVDAGSLGKTLP